MSYLNPPCEHARSVKTSCGCWECIDCGEITQSCNLPDCEHNEPDWGFSADPWREDDELEEIDDRDS